MSPRNDIRRLAGGTIAQALLLTAVFFGTGSCELTQGDPVHESQVAALGDEAPGIPQGEFHRAGQPCGVCHSGQGPAKAIFAFAGTVFAAAAGTPKTETGADPASTGVEQAGVGVIDSNSLTALVLTNCVGNFFISPDEMPGGPVFPVRVAVSKGKSIAVMNSHIGRSASCAECHSRLPGDSSAGQVFIDSSDVPMDCPSNVSPVTPAPVPK